MKKTLEGKDIDVNMRYIGHKQSICNHFCRKALRKCKFYAWYTYLDGNFVREMCENCVLREKWGYNYKSTKGYKKWAG